MLVSEHSLVATVRIRERVSYFADYCYASTWLNRPHSLLHSLSIFSFSLCAKMLVVNHLWMKAVLDQDWHFCIFVFGVLPSFLTFDTYTWFFLSHSVRVHLLQWHHAQHSQVGQIAHYDIACDNSRGTVFQTLEFPPLKDKLKDRYCMTHDNRFHPSALLCHRPAEERGKGDTGFLDTVTVKGKYPLLGKEIL